jgi:hypothetical protein
MMKLDFAGVIPTIPVFIPVEEARALIEETHCCMGQKGNVVMLVSLGKVYATPRNNELWTRALFHQHPLVMMNAMNELQQRIMMKESSEPEVIAKLKDAFERGLAPEEAKMHFHEQYEIPLTPEDLQRIGQAEN